MFQGKWTCSGCNGAITELPFEPRSDAGLLCRECHQKQRASGSAPTGQGAPHAERKMFTGTWKCSACGGAITQLPFEPRDDASLKCVDCFKKSKGG
jgi:CxxC-x17-CxxC domain-containing protein